jgi:hypothetical protein
MGLREFYHEQDKEADGIGNSDDPAERFKLKRKGHFTPNKGRDFMARSIHRLGKDRRGEQST